MQFVSRFIVTVGVAVIILVGLGSFAYLGLRSNTQAVVTAPGTASVNSVSGLQLRLDVIPTVLANQTWGVRITVTEFNTENHKNNVTGSDRFSEPNLLGENSGFLPCWGETPLPFGFELLNGSYSLENYTLATHILNDGIVGIWNGTISCPLGYNASSYLFSASSDNATITLVPGFSDCIALPCTLSSYQLARTITLPPPSTLPGTSIHGAFRSFRPGTYTIVAGDEWGAVVLLQFVVP
jgi:hypothetical protein